MKLRSQVLTVISPIIIIGLFLLTVTALILVKERKEYMLSNQAAQAHIELVKVFGEVFDENNHDIFVFTLIDDVTKLLHDVLTNKTSSTTSPQLNQVIGEIYHDSHSSDGTIWQVLTDEAVEIAYASGENDFKLKSSELVEFLPKLPLYDTVEKLTIVDRDLYAISIHDISNALVTLYGGNIEQRVYVAIYREIPPPAESDARYQGIVHSAINIDDTLKVFSPINNPLRDRYDANQLLNLSSTEDLLVYKEEWNNFVVMTLVELSYAEDWSRIFLFAFFGFLFACIAAIGLVIWVLNRAIVTPVTWLSNHINNGDIFTKPEQHPSLGSVEIKSLYRGIVRSSRKLESLRISMEQASLVDELTGLGNRRLFYKTLANEVASCNRRDSQFALLLIDLDNFKYVNDAYGHDVGDKLLTNFSTLLKEQIRTEDTLYNIIENQHISRLGGDEFAIVLKDIQSPTESALVAERIIKQMNAGIFVDGISMPVTSSIGIAVFPSDANNPKNLMLCVDAAMYQAKSRGKNGYCFYNKRIASQLSRELEVEQHLRQDFVDNKLELFVQPIYSTDTLQISGGEILLRWNNEQLGLVNPSEFIPIAEKVGLIREIDVWVIEQTCHQIQQAKEHKGLELEGLAINVSAVETRNPQFASRVEEICRRYQVQPETIELEITETALIEDLEAAATVTGQLKEMGIKIALDDFGTGYSSISHLKDVKFDKLKVDRRYIAEIDDKKDAFLVADISLLLAHGMNMTIAAEGVNTETQLAYLKAAGCDFVQGNLLSKPVPMFEYIKMVEQQYTSTRAVSDTCN
ncbi:MAG: EAL domain-containing protein [Gammaproteobacteria bacterium]|nr:EAL domain-containing protein [Gammaproteobacteria bacterium]